MKENWDYVSFENYSKDMQESSDRASNIIRQQRGEIDRLNELIAGLVYSNPNHEILIPTSNLDINDLKLTVSYDPCEMRYIYKANRR